MSNKLTEKDWMIIFHITNGIGSVTMNKIYDECGSFDNAANIGANGFKQIGLSKKVIDELLANIANANKIVTDIYTQNEKHNIKIISINDIEYPTLLKEIYDPPFALFTKGDISLLNEQLISVVGTREPSYYGKWASVKLGEYLASRNIPVVSGLARGVDKFVHEGVLNENGKCIAVIATGLAEIYPKEHKYLLDKIIDTGGCIISEYSLFTKAKPGQFPARNRIISGLSLATVVIESKQKGGALITADQALDQNREVFALPGNINSPNSDGTNYLIKQGAKILTKWDDIFEELQQFNDNYLNAENKDNKENKENKDKKSNTLTTEEVKLLDYIPYQEIHIDLLKNKYNKPNLFVLLLQLEKKNYILSLPGQHYVRLY